MGNRKHEFADFVERDDEAHVEVTRNNPQGKDDLPRWALPGVLLAWGGRLLFGQKDPQYSDDAWPIVKSMHKNGLGFLREHGLLGSIFKAVEAVFIGAPKAVFKQVYDHARAVSAAMYASVIIGGAIALTLGLGPASLLAAVVSFSVLGLSIASIAATTAMQLLLITAIAVAATSLVVFSGAAIGNFVQWAFGASKKSEDAPKSEIRVESGRDANADLPANGSNVSAKLGAAGSPRSNEEDLSTAHSDAASTHSSPLHNPADEPANVPPAADEDVSFGL